MKLSALGTRNFALITSATLVGATLVAAAPPDYRSWTVTGKEDLRAKLIPGTTLSETVTLEEADGKTTITKFRGLAPIDQEYIDLWYVKDALEKEAEGVLKTADIAAFLRARDNAVLDYKVSDRAAFFSGKINGKDIKFFLDTGAFASFIDYEVARNKLGLEPFELSEDQWGSGVDGIPQKTYATRVDTIELGEIKINNHRIRAVDIARSQFSSHMSGRLVLDAVLGYDILDELDAVITYKGKRIFIPRNLMKKDASAPDLIRDALPAINIKATDTRGLKDSVDTPVNITGMIRKVEETDDEILLHFFGRKVVAAIPTEVAQKLPGGSVKRFANQDAKITGLLKEAPGEGRRTTYRIKVAGPRFIEVNEVWKPTSENTEPAEKKPVVEAHVAGKGEALGLDQIIGYRTWIDRFGKQLRARPYAIEDGTHVKLMTSKPQSYAMPINDLSKEDQEFLKIWPNPTDGTMMSSYLQTISLPEFAKTRGFDSVDFKADDSKILVKCEVEGTVFDFFIDTGAQSTGMGYEAADKLGLDLKPGGTVTGWGGKRVPVFEAHAKKFKVGSAEFENVELLVIEANWDGIFGWDLLEKLDAAIDYKNKVMYFKK
jgi:predicted aspartyl protease